MAKAFGGVDVTLEGFDELQTALNEMRDKGAEKAIRKGLRAGAKITQAAIQERAPVRVAGPSGTALPPGALAADINIGSVKKIGNGDAYIVSVGPGRHTSHVATWVEYGHENISGGRTGPGGGQLSKVKPITPAYPFIRPAFEASQADATQAIIFTIQAEVSLASNTEDDEANESDVA